MKLARLWASLAVFLLSSLRAAEIPCAVPGFDRLRAAGGNWQAEAGEILFSELSCAACHHQDKEATAPKPAAFDWKAGPDLSAAGDRLRASYIRIYLADPGAVKPGTTMPNLFAAMKAEAKAEVIEDLTHYLMSSRSKKKSTTEPAAGAPKSGRALFLSLGCVACHGTQPLPRLGEKYAPGELARFLMNPLGVRPSGRMPDQHLGRKDAANIAAWLAQAPAPEPPFAVDPERARRGRKTFMSIGCVSCHDTRNVAKPVPLADLQAGCLSPEPKSKIPHYNLTDDQRGAIRAAFAVRGKDPGQDNPQAAIRRIMLQRNCFACHNRSGLGGPAPDIAVYFTSSKDDLGDLGRLPPLLDGVGRKFQRTALETVLKGRDPVRTYMRVRMPGFGDELARELSKLFAAADLTVTSLPASPHKTPELAGKSEWGRELVGLTGYACITCHDLNGHASLGIGACDLAHTPKRLRPEWMHDFLLNPPAFPTGSRMPPFWPGGTPMNPKLAGGTAESQIDSIRRYLAEVDELPPPIGISDKVALELKPAERPIVFRSFVKGTGTHAIAIGFPGGANAVFDALAVRWSLAWRGRFIDADGTWNQRYVKMEKPLGEDLLHLEAAGALSVAGHDDLKPEFRGYHLTAKGVPVFDYDLGGLHVEDSIEPLAKGGGLRRSLRISGQTTETVQFNAKPPPKVTMRMGGSSQFPAQVGFHDGKAELEEEITW